MSILKVILHRWNKTTKSHDTVHPETEVAQVTDWNQGIVNTLASTALGGLVNTLTSDSLLAKMIQKVLEATGVKYSLGQNGYVCFGSLVGGLIIQWGSQASGNNWQVYYPLVFNSAVYGVWINDYAAKNNNLQYVGVSEAESSLNGFKMYTSAANNMGIVFFAIGR